jgi:hypothetical protein
MKERLVSRVTADFFLRYADLMAQRFDGSFQRGIIFLAVVQANIAHIGHLSEDSLRYASLDSPPPDSVRRPAPINAIANSLSLPYETVRRHIHGLIEDGYCVKVRGKGVIVPSRILESEENLQALRRSYDYLRNMISVLRRAGVDLGETESVRETV